MSVLLQTDRAIANELVRHRVASYTQNSTRYINYSKRKFNKEIAVVRPSGIEENTPADTLWRQSVQCAENAYMSLVRIVPPETARAVLPLCTATTIMCSANLREWLHIFNLRVLGTTGKPHPDIVKLLAPVLLQVGQLIPEIFGDIAARYTSCEPYSPAL